MNLSQFIKQKRKSMKLTQVELSYKAGVGLTGITFHDIKQLTDRIIPKAAKQYMQVGLFFGHHLGLSTGDPNLPTVTLQPGMIFTVEPWYYNHDEQISVFTEDVILVTKDGCEILSKTLPRTTEGLEDLMKE